MLGYTTEINLKKLEVVTTFGKERRTFCFNHTSFPLLEAMKVAAEDMHNQILDRLAALVDFAERDE